MSTPSPSPLILAQLLRQARAASRRAYSPYSRYRVGAALLTRSGRVFTGCNVENASYGLTVCAERVALFAAVAAGERRFAALAIAAGGPSAPTPCGACRQVLAEFCDGSLPVLVALRAPARGHRTFTLDELLPCAFTHPPRRPAARRNTTERHA